MNIKEFAEAYKKYEKKAEAIMEIYGLGDCQLEGFDFDEWRGEEKFYIRTSHYLRDYKDLEFNVEEMDNDLDYFKKKYKKQQEEEQKEKERVKRMQEKMKKAAQLRTYLELKEKFGDINKNRTD